MADIVLSQDLAAYDRRPLSAEELATNPAFLLSIRFLASRMRAVFDEGPRLARLLASHQRWMLTQAAYALSVERDPQVPSSGLTTANLVGLITRHGVASRNTVIAFLDEILTYRFIQYLPGEERRRPRHFEPADVSHRAMASWMTVHLVALDIVDEGRRASLFAENASDILRLAQPRLTYACIENRCWREPPFDIGLFLWADACGLVIDHIMANIDLDGNDPERLSVGRIETRALAADFMMSRTHLQRLFARAAAAGILGWSDGRKKMELWVSRAFVTQYACWQAVKFASVDEAFWQAKAEIEARL